MSYTWVDVNTLVLAYKNKLIAEMGFEGKKLIEFLMVVSWNEELEWPVERDMLDIFCY
jgi:hypothetical protein